MRFFVTLALALALGGCNMHNTNSDNQTIQRVLKSYHDIRNKELRADTDEWICSFAAQNGQWSDNYPRYVEEARRRGLTCDADNKNVSSTTSPLIDTPSATTGMVKAEKKCTSLGFTAGTEKHADCVMKLMGN